MRRVTTGLLGLLLVATAAGQAPSAGRVVALQVALDRAGFSPGIIDGKMGSQTEAALTAWRAAHDPAAETSLVPRDGWARPYLITSNDVAAIGRAPADWRERSQQPSLAYESLRELVAEKFHCHETLLQTLNPARADWTHLAAGDTVIVPAVESAEPVTIVADRVRVSLGSRTLQVLDGEGRVRAHFPCSIAAREEKRPVGLLTIMVIVPQPDYTFDPENFPELDEVQRGYGKLIIAPGPNNPVGTVWIGLSQPGYGIHGTPHPEQVGRTESHGCFRLANWNAERLLSMVRVGTLVEISAD